MKEKLFKWLFPQKAHELKFVNELKEEDEIHYGMEIAALKEELKYLKNSKKVMPIITPFNFADVDETAKPPHPLKGLDESARKNALARLEAIFSDDWFILYSNYVINVLANHSFQVEPDETKMRNGRYAVIGVRTLIKEFEEAHNEFMDAKKGPDEFDPLDIMPH